MIVFIVLLTVLLTVLHVGYVWDVFSGRHGARAKELDS